MSHPLEQYRLVYLATVYTSYPQGIDLAFADACVIGGRMLRAGITFFSPIAHTHPIAIYGNINPLDHEIWIPFDEPMMEVASALVVACMPNWKKSYGIGQEIAHFRKEGKPVWFMNPVTLEVIAIERCFKHAEQFESIDLDLDAVERELGLTSE